MDRDKLEQLLTSVAAGDVAPAYALQQLKDFPYHDLGFARIDSHRSLRQGLPEVIFCPGKTAVQIAAIASKLRENHSLIVATKATVAIAEEVLLHSEGATYNSIAKMIVWGDLPTVDESARTVNLVSAGTADIPMAEEAALFLAANGVRCERLFDVGVAGIHRLFSAIELLKRGDVTIVVAGMDGALPSVLAGLLQGPVIAVPTSVGYGVSLNGLAALLTMLNSCAAGLTVVNIDNGFGAAVAALRILSLELCEP